MFGTSHASECPWFAMVHFIEQSAGLVVVDDLLFFRIPFQRPAKRVGDVAQVARRDGTVRRFRRADCRLAALHAFKEVACVIPGFVRLELAWGESRLQPVTV